MASMLNLHEEQEAYAQAIAQLQNSYGGSSQTTDFAAVIKANMTRVLEARRCVFYVCSCSMPQIVEAGLPENGEPGGRCRNPF